jgi:RNA polymerase sporulation-specific sigma factor
MGGQTLSLQGGILMSDRNQKIDLQLLNRSRNNDGFAKEELIKKYTPMVRYIVRTNHVKSLEFEDMLQEGFIGLLSAIDEYNFQDYNVKFSSFAYLCIVRKIYNIIRQSNNYKNRALNHAISLQMPTDDGQTRILLDFIASERTVDPEDVLESTWTAERINDLLKNHLSVLEYTVVGLIVNGYTVGEIEERIGIDAKSIDNARTRVRFKLQKIISKYGSLTSPHVPHKVRKREDLYIAIESISFGDIVEVGFGS